MSKRWMVVVVVALFATFGIAAYVAAAEAENPLEPLDASSPRAAYLSFLDLITNVEEATLEYREDRSLATQSALVDEVTKTRQLADLTEVPAASQDKVVEEIFAALADILQRIPLPDPGTIPDADMVMEDELTQWTLPGTEITFGPLTEGDRAGSWVLSPRTVENLPRLA